MPLYELVTATVLSSPKIFADDTSLPALDPGRGRTKTGYLWCYAVDDRPWCGPTAMRFEHALQTASVLGAGSTNAHLGTIAHRNIKSAKLRLWHGRWKGCLIKLAEVRHSTEAKSFREVVGIRTLRRHLRDLFAYLEANQSVW